MVTEFDFGREHGAEGLADGGQVVAADPLTEFDQFGGKRGNAVEKFGDFFDAFGFRGTGGDCQADADHRAIAEWDKDAAADEFFAVERGWHGVGEGRAQRDGERDFEVALRHWISWIV